MNKEIVFLDINSLKPNPFQPRTDFDDDTLKELSESVKSHGLIQPVVVRAIDSGYQLISGERRLRACKEANLEEIPAIVLDIDGVDVAEVSLIENLQRKDLNSIEEAIAFNILKKQFGMTQDDIATKIGKSRPYVTNCLRLLELPDEVKTLIIENKLSPGHGRALLSLPNAEMMKEVVTAIRNIRKTKNIPFKESIDLYVIDKEGGEMKSDAMISKLVNVSEVDRVEKKMDKALSFRIRSNEYFIPFDQHIDADAEREKLEKELEYNKGFLASVQKKLSNERFVKNAPEQVILNERKKEADALAKIEVLQKSLEAL